jgi:hypothetical protein
MRRLFMFLTAGLLFALPAVVQAADVLPEEVSSVVVDLSTFTGIVAFASLVVTQVAKVIPAVDASAVFKILISAAVGVGGSLLSWRFGWAEFLDGQPWWQVLLQGLFIGLTASGAFDLLKGLFGKKT